MELTLFETLMLFFAVNVVLELVVGLLFRVRSFFDISLIFLVNALTTAPVLLSYNLIGLFDGFFSFIAAGIIVAIIISLEGRFYKYCSKAINRPFALSVAANVLSYSVGLLTIRLI